MTTEKREGYKNFSGTKLSFEGLASNDYTVIPISVDAAARDVSNPDGSTTIRPYMAMGWDSSSGRYKPFNSALHPDTTVVILAEELRDMDSVTSFANAVAFLKGTFKSGVIIEPTAVTWADVQRITVRDNA